jgi:hypothetical protein
MVPLIILTSVVVFFFGIIIYGLYKTNENISELYEDMKKKYTTYVELEAENLKFRKYQADILKKISEHL